MPEYITRYVANFNVATSETRFDYGIYKIHDLIDEDYFAANRNYDYSIKFPKSRCGKIRSDFRNDLLTVMTYYTGTYEETIEIFRAELLKVLHEGRELARKRVDNIGIMYHKMTEIDFSEIANVN